MATSWLAARSVAANCRPKSTGISSIARYPGVIARTAARRSGAAASSVRTTWGLNDVSGAGLARATDDTLGEALTAASKRS
jgi:hypothetical protein